MQKCKKNILVDLIIIFCFLPLSLPLFLLFGEYINSNHNFLSIVLLSIIEFCCAGLGAFIIIFIRKEKLSDYGFIKNNIIKSIFIGIIFSTIMITLASINAGELLYFPMRNHTAMIYSLELNTPLNLIGIILTLGVWGLIEGIYYVVILKKIEELVKKRENPWFSSAPLIFFAYDFIIHFAIRVLVEQRNYKFCIIDIILSLILAYAMFIPRKKTGNSSGSLLYQTIQNGLGKL